MSSIKNLACISIILLPESTGAFKIRTLEDASIMATPTKKGRVGNTPKHMHNSDTKQWIYLDNNIKETIFGETGNLSSPDRI